MQYTIQHFQETLSAVLGVSKLLYLLSEHPLIFGLMIANLFLAKVWMERLWRGEVARAFFPYLPLMALVAELLAITCAGVTLIVVINLRHFLGVSSIWVIGPIIEWFASSLLSILLMILLAFYILWNMIRIHQAVKGLLKGEAEKLAAYQRTAGMLLVVYFLFHPWIMAQLYYLPVVVSAVVGLVTLVLVRSSSHQEFDPELVETHKSPPQLMGMSSRPPLSFWLGARKRYCRQLSSRGRWNSSRGNM